MSPGSRNCENGGTAERSTALCCRLLQASAGGPVIAHQPLKPTSSLAPAPAAEQALRRRSPPKGPSSRPDRRSMASKRISKELQARREGSRAGQGGCVHMAREGPSAVCAAASLTARSEAASKCPALTSGARDQQR